MAALAISLGVASLALAAGCLYLLADRERLASHRRVLCARNADYRRALAECRSIALRLRSGRLDGPRAAFQLLEVTTKT